MEDPDVTPAPKKKKVSLKSIVTPFAKLCGALKTLRIPKKLVIPVIAAAVLLIAGGVAFGLLHTRLAHSLAKTAASAQVASAPGASTTAPSAACSGLVRDIYRQTLEEEPSVTLAEIRSEVQTSGVTCAPVPAIAAQLKGLSPGCRDMVQYTYLEAHEDHADVTVNAVRAKVVQKSVACEHDRSPNIAAVAGQKLK